MLFIVYTKDGNRYEYRNSYKGDTEQEIDAAYDDAYANNPDAIYIELY